MKVAIVDYGLANIRSIINAFECFDVELYLAERGEQLAEADKIVLPGVGSFDAGMKGLKARGHVEALHHHVMAKKIPYLGICLGFQFIFESSAEGVEKGLGWIKGNIHCFDKNKIKESQVKCFNHHESDALGVCKHCQKGICSKCVTLVDNSMSCKGACEKEVAAYNYMMNKANRVYKNMGVRWNPSIFINGILGFIFLGYGLETILLG